METRTFPPEIDRCDRFQSSSAENVDSEEGDVTMKLGIPGHRSQVQHEPIVISESDESDESDCIIVAVTMTRTKPKNLSGQTDYKKMPFDTDSDKENHCPFAGVETEGAGINSSGDVLLDDAAVRRQNRISSDSSSRCEMPDVTPTSGGFFDDDEGDTCLTKKRTAFTRRRGFFERRRHNDRIRPESKMCRLEGPFQAVQDIW